ncbi:DUF262 domain-containing protein [Halomonas llamarensis]|uniref:DUF262 domain-containing protein n=1 Tax=Halomonas llamarensis TaxID=2945104 RepID=A0ABT0SU78_9GAMM|nr:DUF262 domain-containing protein [Halomonas llamarensis]MCL7931271.1 DUF262 domain-containing protein [Halomonas llamarensis]
MQNNFFKGDRSQLAEEAERQIKEKNKETDYDIREYPVEIIVSKFLEKLDNDRAELFVPDYQREMVWNEERQSRFIESLMLNLPIPYLYVADVDEGEDTGRMEIVDGSQRIRTLVRFLSGELVLSKLEKLDKLNGLTFQDLPTSRRLRFNRKTMRMIELIEVDEDARRQLFDRLNTGGEKLWTMEQRFGSRGGPFTSLVKDISSDELFRELCPVSSARSKRREYEELVLRFFAYYENYEGFKKSVDVFLNDYLDDKNNDDFDLDFYKNIFNNVMFFVRDNFDFGFKKNAKNMSVPRIRFEAIAVGTALALDVEPNLKVGDLSWLDSKEFIHLTRSDASNSLPKVRKRIHFVRNNLLGKEVEDADK